MFDPFGDHETAGYLRNSQQEKALDIVKAAEHALFRAQLPEALAYLAGRARIESEDFLEVHRLLFSALYRGPAWTVLKFCLKRPSSGNRCIFAIRETAAALSKTG